jgi:hypothetical protein
MDIAGKIKNKKVFAEEFPFASVIRAEDFDRIVDPKKMI